MNTGRRRALVPRLPATGLGLVLALLAVIGVVAMHHLGAGHAAPVAAAAVTVSGHDAPALAPAVPAPADHATHRPAPADHDRPRHAPTPAGDHSCCAASTTCVSTVAPGVSSAPPVVTACVLWLPVAVVVDGGVASPAPARPPSRNLLSVWRT